MEAKVSDPLVQVEKASIPTPGVSDPLIQLENVLVATMLAELSKHLSGTGPQLTTGHIARAIGQDLAKEALRDNVEASLRAITHEFTDGNHSEQLISVIIDHLASALRKDITAAVADRLVDPGRHRERINRLGVVVGECQIKLGQLALLVDECQKKVDSVVSTHHSQDSALASRLQETLNSLTSELRCRITVLESEQTKVQETLNSLTSELRERITVLESEACSTKGLLSFATGPLVGEIAEQRAAAEKSVSDISQNCASAMTEISKQIEVLQSRQSNLDRSRRWFIATVCILIVVLVVLIAAVVRWGLPTKGLAALCREPERSTDWLSQSSML